MWWRLGWWRNDDARIHGDAVVKPAEPGARALVVADPHPRALRIIPLIIHAAILVARDGEDDVGRQTVNVNVGHGAIGRPALEKQVRRVLGRVKLALGARRIVYEVAKRPHLVVARGVPIHLLRILQKNPHVGAVHDGVHVSRVRALDAGRHVAVVLLTVHEEPVFVIGGDLGTVHGTAFVMQIRRRPIRRSRHPLGRSGSLNANVVMPLLLLLRLHTSINHCHHCVYFFISLLHAYN